ncbi:MAG: hypothetical protein H6702_05395 [Myxococcales bacterium]|nr:hypothetical protein [Myxococcales bacterium]
MDRPNEPTSDPADAHLEARARAYARAHSAANAAELLAALGLTGLLEVAGLDPDLRGGPPLPVVDEVTLSRFAQRGVLRGYLRQRLAGWLFRTCKSTSLRAAIMLRDTREGGERLHESAHAVLTRASRRPADSETTDLISDALSDAWRQLMRAEALKETNFFRRLLFEAPDPRVADAEIASLWQQALKARWHSALAARDPAYGRLRRQVSKAVHGVLKADGAAWRSSLTQAAIVEGLMPALQALDTHGDEGVVDAHTLSEALPGWLEFMTAAPGTPSATPVEVGQYADWLRVALVKGLRPYAQADRLDAEHATPPSDGGRGARQMNWLVAQRIDRAPLLGQLLRTLEPWRALRLVVCVELLAQGISAPSAVKRQTLALKFTAAAWPEHIAALAEQAKAGPLAGIGLTRLPTPTPAYWARVELKLESAKKYLTPNNLMKRLVPKLPAELRARLSAYLASENTKGHPPC